MRHYELAVCAFLLLSACGGCNHETPSMPSIPAAPKAPPPVVVEHMAKTLPPPRWTPTVQAAEKAAKIKHDTLKEQYALGLAYYKVERYTEAVTTLKPVADRTPKTMQTHYWLACAYMGKNDLVEAVRAFEYITRLPHVPPVYQSDVYGLLGRCYFDLYDDTKAEAALRKALTLDKNNLNAQHVLADLHKEAAANKGRRSL